MEEFLARRVVLASSDRLSRLATVEAPKRIRNRGKPGKKAREAIPIWISLTRPAWGRWWRSINAPWRVKREPR